MSFSVDPGDVVGIIGRNGAGKSTFLKILAHVTQPTRGKVAIRGSVTPLIEVGAGFVGDLSGRENIYVNDAILGLSRGEISRKVDDIVAFAELEQFIDTPLKRYSSHPEVIIGFHTNDFVYAGSASSAVVREREPAFEGRQVLQCTLPDTVLRPGIYYVRLAFSDQFHRLIWYGESLKKFRVVADEPIDSAKLPERGFIDLPITWTFRSPV